MIKLFNSDCFDVIRSLPESSIDLFLQDTPYGVTKNKWDIVPDFNKMWPEWIRVGKKNCVFIFFATQPFASELIFSNRKMFRYDLIWEKTMATGHLNSKKMPLRSHESILIFYKSLPTYNPQKTSGHVRKVSTISHKRNSKETSNYGKYNKTGYDSTERFPRSVIKFPTDKQKSPIHPTQKPVNLLEYIITTYTNIGDTVFDGYGGALTTAKAAKNTNRNAIVCETDFIYFNSGKTHFNL